MCYTRVPARQLEKGSRVNGLQTTQKCIQPRNRRKTVKVCRDRNICRDSKGSSGCQGLGVGAGSRNDCYQVQVSLGDGNVAHVLKTLELHFAIVGFMLCELHLISHSTRNQKGQDNHFSPGSWQRFSTDGRPVLAPLVMRWFVGISFLESCLKRRGEHSRWPAGT